MGDGDRSQAGSAPGFDPDALLRTIAERAVHGLGDACVIALVAPDRSTARVPAIAAHAPDTRARIEASMRAHTPIPLAQTRIVVGVVRTGQQNVVPDVSPAELATLVAAPFAALVVELEVCGLIVTPLRAGTERVGSMSVFRTRGGRPPFTEADAAFAAELADHASIAITHARLLDSLRRELAERRRLEEEAKTFVALVQNSTDFIGMAGLDGSVLFVNQAGRRLVGLAPDADVTGMKLTDFRADGGPLPYADALLRDGHWEGEGALQHVVTGERIPTRVSTFIAKDADGAPLCNATVQHDLRERHKLEAQLRQSQKIEAVGRLAGGIAHDFNNLLTVILSYVALLESSVKTAPERADLQQIRLAGERAAGLTRQLLAFGRKQVLEPHRLDLAAVITAATPMLVRTVGEDVELRVELAPGLHPVHADVLQLEQVLLNLVVNARDAMPSGGTLTITAKNVDEGDAAPLGEHVRISVTDTGSGMDEATRSRAFEPFFTTKPVGRGTGLGLATVHGIVEQSGGRIAVESELGAGTTFHVHLPRADESARPARPSPPVFPPRPADGETILLVEDDPQVRQLLSSVLSRAGYRVVEAANPEEAIAASTATHERVHLLVTDVVLPKMSGRSLAELLTATRPDLRVLYVSGYSEDTMGHHGVLDAGIQLLRKPVTPDVLLARVRDVLDAG